MADEVRPAGDAMWALLRQMAAARRTPARPRWGDRAAEAGLHLVVRDEGQVGLACPFSRLTSWNPNDVEARFCAAPTCHRWLNAEMR